MNRDEYIAGLRELADLLERTPELPLPTMDFEWAVHYYGSTDAEQRAALANIRRLLPGPLEENDPNSGSGYDESYYQLKGNIGALPVDVWASRHSVCRRVIAGTQTPVAVEWIFIEDAEPC